MCLSVDQIWAAVEVLFLALCACVLKIWGFENDGVWLNILFSFRNGSGGHKTGLGSKSFNKVHLNKARQVS